MDISHHEEELKKRLERIKKLEQEVLTREKSLRNKESAKKQVLLRLSPTLWEQIASWSEDDFRSINSQIEYLLSEAVKNRIKGNKRHGSHRENGVLQ